jgi:hypothetical protein
MKDKIALCGLAIGCLSMLAGFFSWILRLKEWPWEGKAFVIGIIITAFSAFLAAISSEDSTSN